MDLGREISAYWVFLWVPGKRVRLSDGALLGVILILSKNRSLKSKLPSAFLVFGMVIFSLYNYQLTVYEQIFLGKVKRRNERARGLHFWKSFHSYCSYCILVSIGLASFSQRKLNRRMREEEEVI